MTNVVINVTTKDQVFPAGTVASKFLFEVLQGGVVQASVESEVASATINDAPPGDYVARVTLNGVSAEQPFTVETPPADVTLQVPDTIVVTFA